MKKILIVLAFITVSLLGFSQQSEWKDIAVTEDLEIYVDPTSLTEIDVDGYTDATVKTVYMTSESRDAYLAKIKRAFKPKDADKKIEKWKNFSYSITRGIYDCRNKRFKITQVEDFNYDNSRIIKTSTKEDKARWLYVDIDTVGDHVLFFICDYDN